MADFRGLLDAQSSDTPQPDTGEGKHVVDLVGEVGSCCSYHGGVLGGLSRVDLGVRVGQCGDDPVLRHGGEVVAVDDPGAETPMKTSAPTIADLGDPVEADGVGVLCDPVQVAVHAVAPTVNDAGDVGDDDVGGPCGQGA